MVASILVQPLSSLDAAGDGSAGSDLEGAGDLGKSRGHASMKRRDYIRNLSFSDNVSISTYTPSDDEYSENGSSSECDSDCSSGAAPDKGAAGASDEDPPGCAGGGACPGREPEVAADTFLEAEELPLPPPVRGRFSHRRLRSVH
mmetsp:Transcript_124887/g.353491  ORF Transcript_124887/g.353491 Transcript_124887/m.353491 type:complete len:145 (+) Transcript_124887:89-523(+)